MDWIFDLVEGLFSNFFIVIVILAGIIGFFKDNSGKKKEQQQRRTQNNPRPIAGNRQKHETSRATRAEQQATSMKAIEDQQKEQMKQLAGRYKTGSKASMADVSHKAFTGNTLREPKNHTKDKKLFRNQMSNNLGRKGLINSIIMAEVIGPSRAKKPYRSVIDERRNK